MRFFLLVAMLAAAAETPTVQFIDIAAKSGLTVANTFGGKDKKDSILESTGTGVAIFDFDGDGSASALENRILLILAAESVGNR